MCIRDRVGPCDGVLLRHRDAELAFHQLQAFPIGPCEENDPAAGFSPRDIAFKGYAGLPHGLDGAVVIIHPKGQVDLGGGFPARVAGVFHQLQGELSKLQELYFGDLILPVKLVILAGGKSEMRLVKLNGAA